jgi:hypothetical protein
MGRDFWSVRVKYEDPDRPEGDQVFTEIVMISGREIQSVMNPEVTISEAALGAWRKICWELYPDE